MTKPKTIKDLDKGWIEGDGYLNSLIKEYKSQIKEKAIKFFLHRLKYRGNPYKIFMDFHNLTEEDLK